MIVDIDPITLATLQMASAIGMLALWILGTWILRHDCRCPEHCGNRHEERPGGRGE